MDKKMLRKLAIANCLFMMLPAMALAAENSNPPAETAKPPAEEVITLDEVVVTAIPLEKYLLTTSVITAKDIEAKGAKNLAEALKDVPGLNLHRSTKNNTTVDIRGMTVSDTKIFIDGVLVNPLAKMTNNSAIDAAMIPADNIAKIEIIKGPAPVTYGADAKGGVIWITTKNGAANPGGKLSITGGSWGTLNTNISYGGGDKKANFYVNAGTEYTDGYDGDWRKSKSFSTKLNWKFENNSSLTFNAGYSLTDKGAMYRIDPIDGHTMSTSKGFWPGLNKWEFRDWERVNLSLDYAKKINEKLDFSLKVYRYTEKQQLWGDGASYDPASGVKLNKNGVYTGLASSDMGYSTKRWNESQWESYMNGVELQNNWKLSSKHTLTFGSSFYNIDWKNSASIDPVNDPSNPNKYRWLNYNNKRYGFYLQDNIVPDERTTITLGIRHDKNEVTGVDTDTITGSATNPTINVLYQLDKRNTLRASYGKTCTFPSVEQLYGIYGNAGLKPEKANNYEIGLKHIFSDGFTGDLALFQNDITDKIDKDPVTRVSYNRTSAKIKGIELELNKKFSQKLTGFVNYTYLDTRGTKADGTETDLTYTPKNHVNYGLSYQAGKGYTLSLTGHWVDRRFTDDTGSSAGDTRTKVNGQTPVYSYLGSYSTLDFKLSRQVNDKFDWYIMVNNIFDKQYEDELFYPAAGRNVMAGVSYKF